MTAIQDVFKRYELKYLLNEVQYQVLMRESADHLTADEFAAATIANIYYDTDDFRLIRASIEKPVYKEKLRLRSYGIPKEESKVFLELKKKFKGVVYKRRIDLPFLEAQAYLLEGIRPAADSQILREIDWFRRTYPLLPKAFIAYDRAAWRGREDPGLRLTFDQNIRCRESCLDLSRGNWGRPLLTPGQRLLEIKISGAMPLWLARLLNRLDIYPASYSKYGACYKKYLLPETYPTKGGIICA